MVNVHMTEEEISAMNAAIVDVIEYSIMNGEFESITTSVEYDEIDRSMKLVFKDKNGILCSPTKRIKLKG